MEKAKLILLSVGAIGILLVTSYALAQSETVGQTELTLEELLQTGAAKIDTDRDGKISFDEYMLYHENRFKSIDSDSDGFVTQQETQEAGMKKRTEVREKVIERRKKKRTESE